MEDYSSQPYETYGFGNFIKERFSSKRNVFTSTLALLILLAGLGAGVILVKEKQLFSQKAAGASVALSLAPATVSVDPGQAFTIAIMVDPAGNNISAASVTLSYPPDKLSLTGVDPGPFFLKNYDAATTAMLNKINTQIAGSATIILGAPCSNQSPWVCYPRSDVDTFAILKFTALAAGTASVSFSSQTQVAATGNTTNVLGTTAGATVAVSGPSPTPTPLPTITSIVGFVDRASCDNPDTAGWTTDNRNHANKLSVRLEAYPNGDPASKIIRSGVIANGYRADLGGVCPPDAKCAYGIKMGNLPSSFLNKQIKVDVYGVASDGQNILTGSGKIIGPCNNLVTTSPTPIPSITPTPTPAPSTPTPTPAPVINTSINGNVDVENCTWAAGWARDQRNYANKVTVRAEAAPVGEPTNVYKVTALASNVRSDLTGVCPPNGACSFGAIWGQFPASFATKKINVTVWGVATDGAQNIIKYAGGNTGTIGPCTNIKSP